MVKNKKGGSGHKRMARKHVSGGSGYQNKVRKKREEGEIYARVIKLNGGQFSHIKCEDGKLRNFVGESEEIVSQQIHWFLLVFVIGKL